MAAIKGQVKQFKLNWKKPPNGPAGVAYLELEKGEILEVSWKKDAHGLWVSFPYGIYGFDIERQLNDESNQNEYRITRRRVSGEWKKVSFIRGREGEIAKAQGKPKTLKVKAQMPGKIIKIHAKCTQELQKGESVLVMEAMKMENEMKAPEAGILLEIKVQEGQAVEAGVELFTIDLKK